jgi:hypothetical protein
MGIGRRHDDADAPQGDLWMDWLAKAVVSTLAVATLLFVAQRFGRRAAGLMTGLPTVTAPALGWLSFEHGAGFASHAAEAGVAAGALCALFAWVYAAAVEAGHRRWVALSAGVAACAVPLPWVARAPLELASLTPAVMLACVLASWAMRRSAPPPGPPSPATGLCGRQSLVITSMVAGGLTVAAGWAGMVFGAFAAGFATSAPVLAALIALCLHRTGDGPSVHRFLTGYADGLLGRTVFVALFGWWVVPMGTGAAWMLALVASMLLWLALRPGLRWLDRRVAA